MGSDCVDQRVALEYWTGKQSANVGYGVSETRSERRVAWGKLSWDGRERTEWEASGRCGMEKASGTGALQVAAGRGGTGREMMWKKKNRNQQSSQKGRERSGNLWRELNIARAGFLPVPVLTFPAIYPAEP